MRIDAMNQVSQLYSSKATKKTGQAGGLSFSDSLEISRVGRDMQVAKAAVAAAPDVREDRVEPSRQRLQTEPIPLVMKILQTSSSRALTSDFFRRFYRGRTDKRAREHNVVRERPL